jgi:hypothetical protein
MGNAGYRSIKRAVLDKSDFLLTRSIAEKDEDWGPDQIEERQEDLAALALRAWPLKV